MNFQNRFFAVNPDMQYNDYEVTTPNYDATFEEAMASSPFSPERIGFLKKNPFRKGLINSSNANSSDTADFGTPYNFAEYLEGLFSSVGAENQANRLYNSAEAQAQREWSSAEAALNRSWQENMSNTAYSRAVNDLKQAGLNPILAAGGMSSTPTGAVLAGSTASYQTGGGDRASDILNALANSASAVSDVLTFFLPKLSKIFK